MRVLPDFLVHTKPWPSLVFSLVIHLPKELSKVHVCRVSSCFLSGIFYEEKRERRERDERERREREEVTIRRVEGDWGGQVVPRLETEGGDTGDTGTTWSASTTSSRRLNVERKADFSLHYIARYHFEV